MDLHFEQSTSCSADPGVLITELASACELRSVILLWLVPRVAIEKIKSNISNMIAAVSKKFKLAFDGVQNSHSGGMKD